VFSIVALGTAKLHEAQWAATGGPVGRQWRQTQHLKMFRLNVRPRQARRIRRNGCVFGFNFSVGCGLSVGHVSNPVAQAPSSKLSASHPLSAVFYRTEGDWPVWFTGKRITRQAMRL
jgi:hypothetical protein